ncbi:unnamed protein product [Microthlaspi erraticum]|uniref:Uncharacterized protein n=1 Tax=Microthlaspi erraticum TaxID=1685480 RepID=A0A6D2IGG1_9BRAS|nr:unnamed protein product [Microthlaspi erraticum]
MGSLVEKLLHPMDEEHVKSDDANVKNDQSGGQKNIIWLQPRVSMRRIQNVIFSRHISELPMMLRRKGNNTEEACVYTAR